MPHAAIVAIGDELVVGQSLDTNSQWIAGRLTELGYSIAEHSTLPDDWPVIATELKRLCTHADAIVITGGLGPTQDDLTRDALAQLLGEELVQDDEALADLTAMMRARGREVSPANALQALRPESARCVANANGTAPGLVASFARTTIVALPGPPHENRPMLEGLIEGGVLRGDAGIKRRNHLVRVMGVAESDAAMRLGGLLARDHEPLVGITASDGILTLHIRAVGSDADMDRQIAQVKAVIDRELGGAVFHEGGESMEAIVLDRLRGEKAGLVTAESCTGGMIGARMTAISGSSSVFLGGWITYANEHKSSLLGVSTEMIREHGAVSEEVATAMVRGALAHAPSPDPDLGIGRLHAIAVTGIAGPTGGSDEKPVGTVYIGHGWCEPGGSATAAVDVRRFRFPGDRETIRQRASVSACAMVIQGLAGGAAKLLWEV